MSRWRGAKLSDFVLFVASSTTQVQREPWTESTMLTAGEAHQMSCTKAAVAPEKA